jgi:DNA-binding SARP family transcriptional activator
MLQLRTFGGLSLTRGQEKLTGAISQRRRLAILTLLAVSGDVGMSRDKVVAYLWPEADSERARHVLNQLLYSQRRQAGSDALFQGRKTLRLNPDLIQSDAGSFDAALAQGELDRAVGIYSGPFLDGFFLKDAPGFEQWVEQQRDRYAPTMSVRSERAGPAGGSGGRGGHRSGLVAPSVGVGSAGFLYRRRTG